MRSSGSSVLEICDNGMIRDTLVPLDWHEKVHCIKRVTVCSGVIP